MKTVCAWCSSVMSEGEGPVSHGICHGCREGFTAEGFSLEKRKSLREFIDRFAFPVVVLDDSLMPIGTNQSAQEKFGLDQDVAGQCTLGEVVECDNSELPGGCGNTVHCSGCVLRKTVTETNATGELSSLVPAKLTTGNAEITYRISTIRVGGCVVVKLENAG